MNAGSVAEFLARYEAEDKLTERQRQLFESWQDMELVFQITDDEIGNVRGLLADGFDISSASLPSSSLQWNWQAPPTAARPLRT